MIEIRYILLHILLAIILFIYGKFISKSSEKKYWKLALIPIVAFTIEEGLRWGRNIDWCVYYSVYNDYLKGFSTDHEILFQVIWKIYAFLNLPYTILIASCSCFLICSLFYLIKPHKEVIFIAIPFLVFYCANNATNLIRWYMGASFLFFAIRLFQEQKTIKAIILAICSVCTHAGLILAIPIFYFFLVYKRKIFKPFSAITISLLLSIFFEPSFMARFAFISNFFSGFERFSIYASDASGWLTGTGQNAETTRRGIFSMLVANVPLWIYIIVGYKICKQKLFIQSYNILVAGVFLRSMASGLELMGRYAYLFEPFICIIASHVILYLLKQKRNVMNVAMLLIAVILVFVKMWAFCSPMDYTELMHYVWDKQLAPSSLIPLYYK